MTGFMLRQKTASHFASYCEPGASVRLIGTRGKQDKQIEDYISEAAVEWVNLWEKDSE